MTDSIRIAANPHGGLINGMIGVLIFSASLPATRLAVADLDPVFVTVARAAIAAGLGGGLLAWFGIRRPAASDFCGLIIVALGVVVGFPLLTALALQQVSAAHATVFIGLLPLSTAIFGVWRGGERPRPSFWLYSILGSLIVAGFALSHGGTEVSAADGLMVAAIVLCGLGYAEGAALSRRLGGWQVISWSLLLALPAMLPLALWTAPRDWSPVGWPALIALGYVSIFSMLVGFLFWYRGLVLGGVASVGQLQLLQPFFSLFISATLLHEAVGWDVVLMTGAVVLCVAAARRSATR